MIVLKLSTPQVLPQPKALGPLCRPAPGRGGAAVALSEDHKPQSKTELDRIEAAGGFVNGVGRVNGNLNLSRSIGDLKYKGNAAVPPSAQIITAEPDVRTFTLGPSDEFIVCSRATACGTA